MDPLIGTGYYIHKGRKEGLPQRVREELKKFKSVLPTPECLTTEELNQLPKVAADRLQHVKNCKLCSSSLKMAKLTPEKARKLVAKALRKGKRLQK